MEIEIYSDENIYIVALWKGDEVMERHSFYSLGDAREFAGDLAARFGVARIIMESSLED